MSLEQSRDIPAPPPARWHRRVRDLAVGLTAFTALNQIFDYVLYPFAIYKLGLLAGGLLMTTLALGINILVLRAYDWSKRDWLGIETIKSCKVYSGKSRIVGFFARLLKKSDLAAFLFLSLKEDSFVTMVYLRHGSHQYNGMSRRDWRIFLASHLFSNLYWAMVAYTGISLFEWGWKAVDKIL